MKKKAKPRNDRTMRASLVRAAFCFFSLCLLRDRK